MPPQRSSPAPELCPADVAGASGPLPQLRLHRDEAPKSTAAVEFEGTTKQPPPDRGAPASLASSASDRCRRPVPKTRGIVERRPAAECNSARSSVRMRPRLDRTRAERSRRARYRVNPSANSDLDDTSSLLLRRRQRHCRCRCCSGSRPARSGSRGPVDYVFEAPGVSWMRVSNGRRLCGGSCSPKTARSLPDAADPGCFLAVSSAGPGRRARLIRDPRRGRRAKRAAHGCG